MMSDEPVSAGATASHGLLPLHPRIRVVWTLSHGLAYAVPLCLAGIPLSVKFDLVSPVLAGAVAIASGLLLGWRYAMRYAAMYAALHLPDGVLIRRGVWWRSEIFVPRARIQHTEVNQGPLDRRWGMASISLHTAGTRLEHIRLPGLPRDVAERLRDELLDRRVHADGA